MLLGRAGRGSAGDSQSFPAADQTRSEAITPNFGSTILIIQFLAVLAERLVGRSRDTIVRRNPLPEPALGIGVVKGLFLGIVGWDSLHGFVLCGLARRGSRPSTFGQ